MIHVSSDMKRMFDLVAASESAGERINLSTLLARFDAACMQEIGKTRTVPVKYGVSNSLLRRNYTQLYGLGFIRTLPSGHDEIPRARIY